jgi:FkbM family methyltransferase
LSTITKKLSHQKAQLLDLQNYTNLNHTISGNPSMSFRSFVHYRTSLVQNSQFSWRLIADSFRIGSGRYRAAPAGSNLRLELISGQGEWFTFYENLIRQDYLLHLAPLEPGDHVIDIGANIGAFTVLAASKVGPAGRVYAFEPDPKICERLERNVEINGLKNVTVHQAAVAATSGEALLHRYQKSTFSSLHDGVAGRTLTPDHQSFSVTSLGIRDVIDMIPAPFKVALLKVDCEGSEYDIFDAIDADSARRVRQISMEVHPVPNRSFDHLVDRLNVLGFEVQPKQYTMVAIRPAEGVAAAG